MCNCIAVEHCFKCLDCTIPPLHDDSMVVVGTSRISGNGTVCRNDIFGGLGGKGKRVQVQGKVGISSHFTLPCVNRNPLLFLTKHMSGVLFR